MDDLFGTSIEKPQLFARIGDLSQVCGIRRMMYTEGKSAGVHMVEVSTDSGLEFTALPSRGLDISSAVYRGNTEGRHSRVPRPGSGTPVHSRNRGPRRFGCDCVVHRTVHETLATLTKDA